MEAGSKSAAGGRPLEGLRIVVTRPRVQAEDLGRMLEQLGADVIYFSTIRIQKIDGALDDVLDESKKYNWVVFTSANAARIFTDETARLDDGGIPPGTRVAATGSTTADVLHSRGITVDLVPEVSLSESLVDALAATGPLNGVRFLLPRAKAGRDLLPQLLRQYGAEVDDVPLYDTVIDDEHPSGLIDDLRRGEADVLTFASPSSVQQFVRQVGAEVLKMPHIVIAVIGPVTASAVRKQGVEPAIMPAKFDSRSLVEAIEEWVRERRMSS